MDISDTLAPTSDQLDAVDLLGGPRTFTITEVKRGSAEQPLDVRLAEFPRVWRPGKSMRRVLVACWGSDASQWVGKRVTLYCDTEVTFGKDKVGGTRISHLSHIDKPQRVPLLVTRGKSATYTVEPLREAAPTRSTATHTPPTAEQIATTADRALLTDWWRAHTNLRPVIEARVAELPKPTTPDTEAVES